MPPDPVIPEPEALLLGRYRLGRLLGRGGMADVHEAWDSVRETRVAVKLFRPGVTEPGAWARQRDEVRALSRVDHPHLVHLLDASLPPAPGPALIVVEVVDGPTLAARLRTGPPMTAAEVARLGTQLAGALAAVAAAGVVHRDVKPANVLLDAAGGAKLTDLGIARLADATRHTQTGWAVGTPAYLAPEQVLGTEVGPPADVYALGLLLLEARTGHQEYSGGGVEAAVARLHRQPELPAGLGEGWVGVLAGMTARAPADRPTAGAAEATLAALADGPVGAGPTRLMPAATTVLPPLPGTLPPAPPRPVARRRRSLRAALAALLLLLLAGGGGALLSRGGGSPAPVRSPATTPTALVAGTPAASAAPTTPAPVSRTPASAPPATTAAARASTHAPSAPTAGPAPETKGHTKGHGGKGHG